MGISVCVKNLDIVAHTQLRPYICRKIVSNISVNGEQNIGEYQEKDAPTLFFEHDFAFGSRHRFTWTAQCYIFGSGRRDFFQNKHKKQQRQHKKMPPPQKASKK